MSPEEREERERERLEKMREKERERKEREREKEQERREKERERIDREAEKLEELAEKFEEKAERIEEKVESHEEKADEILEQADEIRREADERRREAEKLRKEAEKVRKEARRINISVPSEMSEEWKDWAEDLGSSVSELVRGSMKFVKNNVGDLVKLKKWDKVMGKLGEKIEKEIEQSGLKDLDKKIKIDIEKGGLKAKKPISVDKERIKKRVEGLVKLQKSIPIDKLAQVLNISKEKAENLIYELAAEGIDGTLEEGIFKFTGDAEAIIAKLHEKIDNNYR